MRGLKARTNFVYPAHQTCILSAALVASRAASKVTTSVCEGAGAAAGAQSGRKFDWFAALSRNEPHRALIDYNDVGTVSRSGAEAHYDYTEVLENVERLASAISDPPRRSRSNGNELPQTPATSSMNETTTPHCPRHENAALEVSTRSRNPDEPAIANSTAVTSNRQAPCTCSRESLEVVFQGLVL